MRADRPTDYRSGYLNYFDALRTPMAHLILMEICYGKEGKRRQDCGLGYGVSF